MKRNRLTTKKTIAIIVIALMLIFICLGAASSGLGSILEVTFSSESPKLDDWHIRWPSLGFVPPHIGSIRPPEPRYSEPGPAYIPIPQQEPPPLPKAPPPNTHR